MNSYRKYTEAECLDMLKCYTQCHGKILKARQLYHLMYGVKPPLSILRKATTKYNNDCNSNDVIENTKLADCQCK
jgi:hypothetical protein